MQKNMALFTILTTVFMIVAVLLMPLILRAWDTLRARRNELERAKEEIDLPAPSATPMAEKTVPGPILALRGWEIQKQDRTIGGSNYFLTSLATLNGGQCTWPPGNALKAFNMNTGGSAPVGGKDDGYWGLRFKEDIPDIAPVGGIVAMWGNVVEHEHGWRAEFAYPVAIWRNRNVPMPGFPRPGTSVVLNAAFSEIAALYGIPCLDAPPWCGGKLVASDMGHVE